jgi:lysozyme family protein
MTPFKKAFVKTMDHEGKGLWSNRQNDSGGETYSGISRVYWPGWTGWALIDRGEFNRELLDPLVEDFYRVNFWNRIQGDRVANLTPEIAFELFDSAVHCGVSKAVEFMQNAYNVANCERYPLVVDGLLGPITSGSIKRYLETEPGNRDINSEILLNCMDGEQYIFYKANPNHKNNRGWFRRL